jgi:hypothetical protein
MRFTNPCPDCGAGVGVRCHVPAGKNPYNPRWATYFGEHTGRFLVRRAA